MQLREKSRALAAQAEELYYRDQGQALDFAIRGWQTAKTEEARLAVTKTFPQLLVTVTHSDAIEIAIFSSDGQRILTASDDHTARLWNSMDGHLLATLVGHTDKIVYAEFSPDGKRIVTASFDHTARTWNASSGMPLATLQGHTDKLMRAQFSPDGERVVTASYDHTARVWSSADGRLLGTLKGHNWAVDNAAFSPDGQRIVTASWDGSARIWSSTDYTSLNELVGHNNALLGSAFSPDGQRIVTYGSDHTARVWSSSDAHLLFVLRHDGPVKNAIFSPNGRCIATASFDRKGLRSRREWIDSVDLRVEHHEIGGLRSTNLGNSCANRPRRTNKTADTGTREAYEFSPVKAVLGHRETPLSPSPSAF